MTTMTTMATMIMIMMDIESNNNDNEDIKLTLELYSSHTQDKQRKQILTCHCVWCGIRLLFIRLDYHSLYMHR